MERFNNPFTRGCHSERPVERPHVNVELFSFDGIDLPTLRRMYGEWRDGLSSKSELERRYLGKGESHGKLFSGLVRRYLHVETERSHPLVRENKKLTVKIKDLEDENERLRNQLRFDH